MSQDVLKVDVLARESEPFAASRVASGMIRNDRELLHALQLNDAVAASYLGKSRQALNNGLLSKKSDGAPDDYFRIGEISLLITAATARGTSFDRTLVRQYLEMTRSPEDSEKSEPWLLVMEQLDPSLELDFSNAELLVYFLPDFAFMRSTWPEGAEQFRNLWARSSASSNKSPRLVILSTVEMDALAAERWIVGEDARDLSGAAGNEAVAHYLPMVLVYGRELRDAYWLCANGEFAKAPQFRSPLMDQCLLGMVSGDLRDQVEGLIAQSASGLATNRSGQRRLSR